MTEQEWLAFTDPQPMLEFLRDKATDRKLRLFACACCRRICQRDRLAHEALAMNETLAEEIVVGSQAMAKALATAEALLESETGILAYEDWAYWGARATLAAVLDPVSAPGYAATAAGHDAPDGQIAHAKECKAQAVLFRDIFGNPFRSIALNPTWLTSTVTMLAESIYQERAFERLPILADALEDAGCHNAEMLSHCRNGGEHVRGCWCVDLVLGKS